MSLCILPHGGTLNPLMYLPRLGSQEKKKGMHYSPSIHAKSTKVYSFLNMGNNACT